MAQFNRIISLILLPVSLAVAQQTSPKSAAVFHAESDLVLVPFHVSRENHFVPDLKKEEVILMEDGKPRDFSIFEGPAMLRREPLDLVLLFDTTMIPPAESKGGMGLIRWNRRSIYGFTSHWDDTMSRAVLAVGPTNVARVSVYRFDHRQLQRLCRSISDPQTLTQVIRHLPDPIPADQAIPLTLPPNRAMERSVMACMNRQEICGSPSWTAEAMIATLKDSATAPDNARHLMAVFSQMFNVTTTTPQDVADQAVALGEPVYPVVLDAEAYVTNPVGRNLRTGELLTPWRKFVSVGELTGGRALLPDSMDVRAITGILDSIRNEGLSQYTVGFLPPSSSGSTREHKLEVRLQSKSTGKMIGGKRTTTY